MGKNKETIWEIEPHTKAKHEILKRYLGAWFPILGRHNNRLLFLDGFCGPGCYKGGEDGSPIIALKLALHRRSKLERKQVIFLFIDDNDDRIDILKNEIATMNIPNNWKVHIKSATFDSTIKEILDDLDDRGLKLAPTFAFLDPFGFKGVPFDLVSRLLNNPKTEVFINFPIDSINRFIEHPDKKIQKHIINFFGTSRVLKILNNSQNRIASLKGVYQEQLQKNANFVRYFEMRNYQGRVIYYLFFATNHRLGHVKMKEAFWKLDPSYGFMFSDRTNPNQLVLFEADPSSEVINEIVNHFSGQITFSETIIEYIEDETPYIAKHVRKALIKLEQDTIISVDPIKRGGKKRRKGSFPVGTTIRF